MCVSDFPSLSTDDKKLISTSMTSGHELGWSCKSQEGGYLLGLTAVVEHDPLSCPPILQRRQPGPLPPLAAQGKVRKGLVRQQAVKERRMQGTGGEHSFLPVWSLHAALFATDLSSKEDPLWHSLYAGSAEGPALLHS